MSAFSDQSITVIGSGALGGALIDFFEKHSFTIRSVYNSRGGYVNKPDERIVYIDRNLPEDESQAGNVIFLCVPDDQISKTAQSLAKTGINWHSRKVVHCSGNLFSDELQSLDEKGAQTASMHPIQTFQRGDKADRFTGIFISLEGNEEFRQDLKNLVTIMKAKPLDVQKEQKQILHIAAVFASNYVVAVLHQAESLLKKNGIEKGLDTLEPLIRQTIENSLDSGPKEALSGPVARGDSGSVTEHLKALETDSELLHLYKTLGLKALEIAVKRGTVSTDKLEKMEQILRLKTD